MVSTATWLIILKPKVFISNAFFHPDPFFPQTPGKMPTYVYKRENGTTFEIEQRITAPSLKECPTTGQSVKRIITVGAGLVFKGTGFYQTDYVRNNQKPEASSEKSPPVPAPTESTGSSDSTKKPLKTPKTES